jgi:hypothetical protein
MVFVRMWGASALLLGLDPNDGEVAGELHVIDITDHIGLHDRSAVTVEMELEVVHLAESCSKSPYSFTFPFQNPSMFFHVSRNSEFAVVIVVSSCCFGTKA